MAAESRASASVREANADDARAMAEVNVTTWQRAYRGLLAEEFLGSLSVAERTDHWTEVLRVRTSDHLLVLEEGDGVTGYCHVGPTRDVDGGDTVGELYSLYLRPDRWGRGSGRVLHDAAIDCLADRFRVASLWVLSTNQRARGFYERQGWVPAPGHRTQVFGGAQVVDDRYRYELQGARR